MLQKNKKEGDFINVYNYVRNTTEVVKVLLEI